MLISIRIVALLLIVSLTTISIPAQSVPNLINYQGRLTDQTGAALPSGSYSIEFRLWNSAMNSQSGLILGQRQNVVVFDNGVFNVILGSPGATPISGAAVNDLTYGFTEPNRYLGLTVVVSNGVQMSSPSEILPRQQLMSVPFAVQSQQAQTAQQATTLIASYANTLCPPGTIVAYATANPPAPPGWLPCDGRAISRVDYAILFALIGTSYGAGDGVNTFNLPDTRGFFLRGIDWGTGRDPERGQRYSLYSGGLSGDNIATYQNDAIKSHSHPSHQNLSNSGFIEGTPNPTFQVSGGSGLGMTTFLNTGVFGGPETRPKNLCVNYIIKY